jgi:hypothetical protein
MKVSELIAELYKMPQDMEVLSPDYGNGAYIVPQPHVVDVLVQNELLKIGGGHLSDREIVSL